MIFKSLGCIKIGEETRFACLCSTDDSYATPSVPYNYTHVPENECITVLHVACYKDHYYFYSRSNEVLWNNKKWFICTSNLIWRDVPWEIIDVE
jgi:hypothetical protein